MAHDEYVDGCYVNSSGAWVSSESHTHNWVTETTYTTETTTVHHDGSYRLLLQKQLVHIVIMVMIFVMDLVIMVLLDGMKQLQLRFLIQPQNAQYVEQQSKIKNLVFFTPICYHFY